MIGVVNGAAVLSRSILLQVCASSAYCACEKFSPHTAHKRNASMSTCGEGT